MEKRYRFPPIACTAVPALLLLGCCGTKPPAPKPVVEVVAKAPPTPEPQSDLISRELLFSNPDRAAARVSPDGAWLSFLAPVDGVLNVWVGPLGDPTAAKPVTDDKSRGIRIYFWAHTNRHIVYLQDVKGDENWHVYSVDLDKGTTIDLTPLENVHATIEAVSYKFKDEILVGLNDRDAKLHDIYRINLVSLEKTLIQENPGFSGFIADDEFNIRFAEKMTDDGGSEIFQPVKPDKKKKKKPAKSAKAKKKAGDKPGSDEVAVNLDGWESFMKISMADSLTTTPIGFDKTGRILYMLDSRDRDTAAFATLNLDTNELKIVTDDPRADLQDLMIRPVEKTVDAVAFTYLRKEWKILDQSIADDFDALAKVAPGDFEVVSRTLKDDTWIVAYILDDGPIRYYRYDRASREATFMFTNRPALEEVVLAKMHPRLIQSRDGKTLVSYLSLPPGGDGDGDGTPDVPLPMVLNVHGGPWARDTWGYDATHQWLANHGYAVLSVNFRGSTGFGKSFINAGNLAWGAEMHDDLIDAVNWAIEQKVAQRNKIAIMGGSYGGYATLVGLTFTPRTFACGVDIVGPSNLNTFIETIPPYWTPMIELIIKRVGDHRTEEGREFLKSRSPLTFVHKIERPLLIAQGANDPRVKQSESDQITQAMKEKKIPVTYVLYPDEGHGFARPQNRLSFNAITEIFLSECLGGGFEPIGDDFEGSSLTVPEGSENIPGLTEALKPEMKNN